MAVLSKLSVSRLSFCKAYVCGLCLSMKEEDFAVFRFRGRGGGARVPKQVEVGRRVQKECVLFIMQALLR